MLERIDTTKNAIQGEAQSRAGSVASSCVYPSASPARFSLRGRCSRGRGHPSPSLARARGASTPFCAAILTGFRVLPSSPPSLARRRHGPAAVLLVPTRELALQTSQVCKELGKHLGVEVMVTTGGTSLKDDIMRLYNVVHILVATPGRVLDLAGKGVCKLGNCGILVMDEADKLLSPEFQPLIEQIIGFLPPNRQILLYSATFPVIFKNFKDRFLNKPVRAGPRGKLDGSGGVLATRVASGRHVPPPFSPAP